MDADELLDDDLVNYVKRINFEKILTIVFCSEGKTFVEMEWIRAAGFYPDSVIRLQGSKKKVNYDTRAITQQFNVIIL